MHRPSIKGTKLLFIVIKAIIITCRNPSSLSVDCINSKIYSTCRASLIATPSGPENCLQRKPLDRSCTMSPDFLWLVITFLLSCAFSARFFLLRILRNSSYHHSVLMFLVLSSVTNLSLFFGFCATCMLSYRCLQMEWWAVVTVVVIYSQCGLLMFSPRASRAVQVPDHQSSYLGPLALFSCQTIRALTSGLLRYSAQPTPCWLHLAYFGWYKTGYWRISCHRHPQSTSLLS